MGLNLTQKIIKEHLLDGHMVAGEEIAIRIDQTLTHDTLGMMAMLEFEAIGIPRVKTKKSVCYIDHALLQNGPESHDDHRFLESMAAKYGLYLSRAGNGICHQVHLERFSEPGGTLLGSDSHTPTSGAAGMLAIGAGGLDVAVAMGGGPYWLRMPKVVRVVLSGRLQPWVASKDIILELLRRRTVRGGVGCIFEYTGEGAASLSVPQRGVMCNMGTELGATSSIFPIDDSVRFYLRAQQRDSVWRTLAADPDATYDETVEIDLSRLEPLVACPGSPDNVVPVREVEGLKIDQVCVGSCTNSSYVDLMTAAATLKGRTTPPGITLSITPGSRQVLRMISQSGALSDLIDSGARLLESACAPCLGLGQVPGHGTISLRSFNRNFPRRSGLADDKVYLCSPEVAAASAATGVITDPRTLGQAPRIDLPERFHVDDAMIIPPSDHPEGVEVVWGPHVAPVPIAPEAPETLAGEVLLKLGDNISTDDIIPPGGKAITLRGSVPALAEYTFDRLDPTFVKRVREAGGGILVGGINWGQGSSREHAALCPAYLGIRAILAKSFARIHWGNLLNMGILPLSFADPAGYDAVSQGDVLEIAGNRNAVATGQKLVVRNVTKGVDIPVTHALTPRQVRVYLDGGLLNHTRKMGV